MTVTLVISAPSEGPRRDPADARVAALMAAYHERHLPLTQTLAAALIRLEAATIPVQDGLWGRAYLCAGESLGLPNRIGTAPFWRKSLRALQALVVEPVLRRAVLGTKGEVHLRGAAALGDGFRSRDADADIEREVGRLLSGPDFMGRGFWIEVGLLLQATAHAGASDDVAPTPFAQAALPRLLFEIEPRMPERPEMQRRFKEIRRALNRRAGVRPKEGGVTGVRVSTSEGDLPDALLSEFLLPAELVADRFLHEGFIVRNRPPKRVPKRDLLVLTLCDRRSPVDGVGVTLAKAAWADAALRLRIMLRQIGLMRSELIWAEASPHHLRASIMPVDGPKVAAAADAFALAGQVRAEHLFTCGLLPDFATSSSLRHDLAPPPAPGDPVWQPLMRHAMRRLKESPAAVVLKGRGAAPPAQRSGVLADYGRILVLVVLADGTIDVARLAEGWGGFRTGLGRSLGTDLPHTAQFGALVCPELVTREHAFALHFDQARRDRNPDLALPTDEDAKDALGTTIGEISAAIIEATIEALHG